MASQADIALTERLLRPMKSFQGGPVFFIDSLRTSLL
jgi:hypothetical protein